MVLFKDDFADSNAGEEEYRPLTYLAIVLDDPSHFPRIATTNDVHRSDILVDALGRNARLRRGYGILLYGSRLEIYLFDNKSPTVIDRRDGVEGTVDVEDPEMMLGSADFGDGDGAKEFSFDLRTTDLRVVVQAFKMYDIARGVVYEDEVSSDEEEEEDDNDDHVDPDLEMTGF